MLHRHDTYSSQFCSQSQSNIPHTGRCIAGHSLGGALATLAAYDLKNVAAKHNLDVQVSCYTYGAPRVGNHAFAEDFDRIINDCFHVVNHQVHLLQSVAHAVHLCHHSYAAF